MNSVLVLYNGQEDKDDVHRIIQCRLRWELLFHGQFLNEYIFVLLWNRAMR
jgi:hypothetical protein